MSHPVDFVQGHKTRRVVVFLPIAFGLGGSGRVPSLARSPIEYGSVGEEKESLVMKPCPISMPARRKLRWGACA